MNSVLVTGANGFVGRRLCAALIEAGHTVQATSRSSAPAHNAPHAVAFLPVGDIGPETEWAGALHGIEVIIHLAARVHVMREKAADAIERYRLVNVEGTRRLALMAARSGVRRFVYVSTVKVNGESTGEEPFRDNDIPSPQDAYAISKWEAEEALHVISSQTGLEIVIIRPPLVYGPGAKGNMLTLMRYVDHGYPLPFGGINNQRSFISLDNLADVLVTAANNAECAGQTFLVSDGEDLSTPELIQRIAAAMNKEPHLINIPAKIVTVIGTVLPAVRPIIGRLTGSLVIDSTRFRRVAGWQPIQTVNAGMQAMVSAYFLKK